MQSVWPSPPRAGLDGCATSLAWAVILSAEALAQRRARQAQRRARQAAEQLSQEQRALVQTLLAAHSRHLGSMFHQFVLFKVRLRGLGLERGPQVPGGWSKGGPCGSPRDEVGRTPGAWASASGLTGLWPHSPHSTCSPGSRACPAWSLCCPCSPTSQTSTRSWCSKWSSSPRTCPSSGVWPLLAFPEENAPGNYNPPATKQQGHPANQPVPRPVPAAGLESRSPESGLLPSSRKLRPDSCLCRSLPLEDQISLLKGATIEICHIALNTTFCLQSQHFLCGPLRYTREDGAHGEMVLDSRGVCPCGVAGGRVTRGSSAGLSHSGVPEGVLRAALPLPRSPEETAAPGARVCALGRHGSLLSR